MEFVIVFISLHIVNMPITHALFTPFMYMPSGCVKPFIHGNVRNILRSFVPTFLVVDGSTDARSGCPPALTRIWPKYYLPYLDFITVHILLSKTISTVQQIGTEWNVIQKEQISIRWLKMGLNLFLWTFKKLYQIHIMVNPFLNVTPLSYDGLTLHKYVCAASWLSSTTERP